jgi:hypothetical protein
VLLRFFENTGEISLSLSHAIRSFHYKTKHIDGLVALQCFQ